MKEIFGCSMKQYCIFTGQLTKGSISIQNMVDDETIPFEYHTAILNLQKNQMLEYPWEKQTPKEAMGNFSLTVYNGAIKQRRADVECSIALPDTSNIEAVVKKFIDMTYSKGCSISEFDSEVNRMRKVCIDSLDNISQTSFSKIVKHVLDVHYLGSNWYGPTAYRTLNAFFEDFLFQNMTINLDSIKQEYAKNRGLKSYLKNRVRNLDLLQLSETSYATWEFFKKDEYKKEGLVCWLGKVAMLIGQNDFVSVEYLFINKLVSPFFVTLDFDNFFYERLLRTIPECKYFSICSTVIFFSKKNYSRKDFLIVFFKKYCPIDIFCALDILKRGYGIDITQVYLVNQLSDLPLYYDVDMERVYESYQDFLKEIS
jgi:hypothetical protein